MGDEEYLSLEAKIDSLVAICEQLHEENQQLKNMQADWHKERAVLKEKNEQIRQRVEAMITRLRALEKDS